MSLCNDAHFAICMSGSLARVYFKNKEFVCMQMTREELIPYATTSLRNMAEHLFQMMKTCVSKCNFNFYYPNTFNKKKVNKINKLLEINVCTIQILIRWLTLLL